MISNRDNSLHSEQTLRQCWTRKKEEQGRRRDVEEGGTRRKEGRGGRSDEDELATRRVKKLKSCEKNDT